MDNQDYSFEDLAVWQKAREIRNVIFHMVKRFPKSERDRLSDAMIKTSRAIGDEIAEGTGRQNSDEMIDFCFRSRGAVNRLINQFTTAMDCNYIEEISFKKNRDELNRCIKLINEYINYLKKGSDKDSGTDLKENILIK